MKNIPLLFLFVIIIASCARVPQPTSYPFSTQKKMQSVQHWDILAADVADRITETVKRKLTTFDNTCLYVQSEQTVFGEAFTKLLNGHLLKNTDESIDNGSELYFVSMEPKSNLVPNSNCLTIESSAQVVKHRADRTGRIYPGTWTALAGTITVMHDVSSVYQALLVGGLLLDVAGGTANLMSHNELLITTKITRDGELLSLSTDMYYINDRDDWHYRKGQALPTRKFATVTEEYTTDAN